MIGAADARAEHRGFAVDGEATGANPLLRLATDATPMRARTFCRRSGSPCEGDRRAYSARRTLLRDSRRDLGGGRRRGAGRCARSRTVVAACAPCARTQPGARSDAFVRDAHRARASGARALDTPRVARGRVLQVSTRHRAARTRASARTSPRARRTRLGHASRKATARAAAERDRRGRSGRLGI